MTREKKVNLTKYLERLNDKLNSQVSLKHAGHPATYKQFLQREIEMVKSKLDAAKLEGFIK